MNLSSRLKPVSYLKAHTAEIIRDVAESGEPFVITQNGVAKAVIRDIHEYEKEQETLALLKILMLGEREIREGRTIPAKEVFRRLRERRAHR